MTQILYKISGSGSDIEVYDSRVTIIERRVSANMADEVTQLAQLHERGVLSADEFAAAKRRVLGIVA